MFYNEALSSQFRLGDVLTNFLTMTPVINKPASVISEVDCSIKIISNHHVIITPCCSIKDNKILLAPMEKIRRKFFENPYFEKDMTRINRKMPSIESISPKEWESLSLPDKQEYLDIQDKYVLYDFFIYAEHEEFVPYMLSGRNIRYYMIDFKKIFCIECDGIQKKDGEQKISDDLKIRKTLELSPLTRKDLREKISAFFFRPAEEDLPFLE